MAGKVRTVHIAWDRSFNRLRLYGSKAKVFEAEDNLRSWLRTDGNWAFKEMNVPGMLYRWLLARRAAEMDRIKAECGLETADLDTEEHTLKVTACNEGPA